MNYFEYLEKEQENNQNEKEKIKQLTINYNTVLGILGGLALMNNNSLEVQLSKCQDAGFNVIIKLEGDKFIISVGENK
jgi:hypothetical protein